MARFAGKTALITGGGTGIGRATAEAIVSEGGNVVLIGRRLEPLEAVSAACGALAVAGDTTSPEDLERAAKLAEDTYGGLDILVANAGIEHFGSVETVGLDDWRKVIETNLEGSMLAARASIPAMRRRGGGAIVLVASVAANLGAPSYVSYLASKAGMHGLNRSLAYDYGRERIRSNVICPGWVATEMTDRAKHDIAAAEGTTAEQLVADVVANYPLRRMAEPEEIARAIAFLASDDSSFITGTSLVADGGGSIVDIGTLPFA
ncbi:SDR family NAD(P)-dependent oxidoreductase [Novosphingobium album (ex Hu et al. 2023)]|uniref:Glucose 1-dehydrogenase n=1 Tax=Novosphingobium album (ex Hu et al. 2023) TaxID=2930093 RepID=A0ABT0AZE8_9SPHN|nr:glucose 1-dehydrogenase [Novosphingobium album (ex Hu et al. 2023)]MCJ2178074.1 glucose 1-dehydrogenase [Novosphingobium album (ex Hu et al. 2023)]